MDLKKEAKKLQAKMKKAQVNMKLQAKKYQAKMKKAKHNAGEEIQSEAKDLQKKIDKVMK